MKEEGHSSENRHVRKVRRVRIKWERDTKSKEGRWSIIKEVIIPRMALIASHEIKSDVPIERLTGLWFEVTDDENTIIYRGKIPDPRLEDLEIFDEEGVPSRAVAERKEFIFDVLIPDAPFMSKVRLYNTKPQFKEQVKKITRDELKPVVELSMQPTSDLLKEDEKNGYK